MTPPKEPKYSCPHLDSAIEEINSARQVHDELRKWGTWWQERANEIEKDLSAEINEKDDEIYRLQERIGSMSHEINNLEKQCDDLIGSRTA